MRTPALDRKQRLLRTAPAFAGVGRRDLAELAATLDVVEVPAGATLLREGEPGDDFHVVLDGAARVVRDGQLVATVTAGSVLGEAALLDRTRRNATVVAETDLVLAVGMRIHLAALLERFPDLRRQVRRSHAERAAA